MGKKSGPAAPAAPDPAATAAAQKDVNTSAAITQANLNRIDQVTPEGSLKYTIDGTNPDGTPKYVQTQTYSDAEQRKYDQNNQVAMALNDTAISNIGRVQQAQATPFTYDGMTPIKTGANAGQIQTGPSSAPPLINTLQSGPLAYGAGTGNTQGNVPVGPTRNTIGGAGTAQGVDPSQAGQGVQGGLNYSNLTQLPGTQDFGAEGKRMADSVYAQAASRLDPRFQQSDSDMRSRLAAQGITENSDAYRRELDNASRDKNDAYNAATYSAQQAGATEQSRLFGLSMNARQQGQNEADTQGNFTNTAQAQKYQQTLAAQAANQSVQGQNFGQNADEAAFYNATQGQIFGQGLQNANLYNSAQDQAYQERSNEAALNNSAQGQAFDQGATKAGLFNDTQQQYFTNQQGVAAFNNQAQNQEFNQGAANASLNNAARQQQIQEAAYLRNIPLNDIAALMSGNQPNAPQFQNVSQVGVAAPDYQGMVQSNYQSALQQQQQKQASRSQMLGSVFGLAGSAMALSDRRFKENIKRIGTLANGLATYAFNYIGDRAQQFGVMAQEVLGVIPDAVVEKNGVMYVDYGRVY